MKIYSIFFRVYTQVFTLATLFSGVACQDETPSFQDETQVTRVKLNITSKMGETTADANPNSPIHYPDEATTDSIWDQLNEGKNIDTIAETSGSPDSNTNTNTTETTSEAGSETLDGSVPSNPESPSGGSESLPTSGNEANPTSGLPPETTPGEVLEPQDWDSNELKSCANLHGVGANQVKIINHKDANTLVQNIDSNTIVALKLVGNQPKVLLDIEGSAEIKLLGICIFATANQSEARISLGVNAKKLVYRGRGNQSQGYFKIVEGRTLEYLAGDLSGNQASLTIEGNGRYPCDTVRLGGNGATFNCKK